VISSQQGALQLRFLQTLVEIGVEKNTTIVLPVPIELIAPILEAQGRVTSGGDGPSRLPQGSKTG
jgi:hypothetical protein